MNDSVALQDGVDNISIESRRLDRILHLGPQKLRVCTFFSKKLTTFSSSPSKLELSLRPLFEIYEAHF